MEAKRLGTEARPDLAQGKMVTAGTKRKGTGLKTCWYYVSEACVLETRCAGAYVVV